MSTHGDGSKRSDGGKGSGRRQEDVKKIHDNWDLIFGTNKKDTTMMNDCSNEDDEEFDDICTWCDGCGEGDYDGAVCKRCKGTGVEPHEGVDDDYI